MEQFPWTPDGLRLLRLIKDIIEHNGGLEVYAKLVDEEVNVNSFTRDENRKKKVFDMVTKYKVSHSDGADILKMNKSEFEHQYRQYKEQNQTKNL